MVFGFKCQIYVYLLDRGEGGKVLFAVGIVQGPGRYLFDRFLSCACGGEGGSVSMSSG